MNPITQVTKGTGYLLRGWQLFKTVPGIKKWVIIPFLIQLFIVFYSLTWGMGLTNALLAQLFAWLSIGQGFFWSLLYYSIWIVAVISFSVVVVYVVFLISTVISSPFNAMIAEKVLMHFDVIADKPFSLKRWLLVSIKMLVISLLRALLFALLGLVIFILSFIPGLNLFSSYLAFVIIVSDSADYAMEVLEMNLRQRMGFLRDHFFSFSGMALITSLTHFVPGLILLLLPVSVLGASEFVAREKLKLTAPTQR